MSTNPIRVFIADDHPVVRQGLEILIESQPDMILIGQAQNGEEAIQKAIELKPDVIVMDLMMPVKNGLVAIEEIMRYGLETEILILTSFPKDEMVILAIEAGANAVMLKDSPPDQLLNAIRLVFEGETALHPMIAQKLMSKVRQSAKQAPPLGESLTPREIDVLKCLAQGLSNRDIASKLSISTRTVTTHVRNILDKLGFSNRTQAALYAVEKGYIEPVKTN